MASSSLNRCHLIIGGDAMIGAALRRRLQAAGAKVWASTRRPDQVGPQRPFVDLAADDWIGLDSLPVSSDLTVYICAAAARIAQCAANPGDTRRVNVEGVAALARAMATQGAHIVFLSTNQVLAGDRPLAPDDSPYGGATEYGRQKAEAEQTLLSLDARVAVLRLAKVLSQDDPLMASWRRDLRAGLEIRPFHDMTAAPVCADLVSDAMIRIAEAGSTGIFQLSAVRDVSYADLAQKLAFAMEIDPALVRPISVDNADLPHRPPPFTSLDSRRIQSELNLAPPDPYLAISAIDSDTQFASRDHKVAR